MVAGRRRAADSASVAARGAAVVPRLPRGRGPRGAGRPCCSRRFPYQAPPKHVAKRQRRAARPGLAASATTWSPRSTGAGRRSRAASRAERSPTRCWSPARESEQRPPADGRRAAGRLLQPADPDGGGRPRARRRGRPPGIDAHGRRRSSASTSTSSSAAAATTRGARPRPARTSSTRSRSTCCGGRRRHYRFRGRCLPIEVLEKTNAWTPTPGDQTPPGTQTLRAERTKLGLVAGRGDRARQAGAVHQAALDVLPRGRLRRRLHGLQRRRRWSATRRASSARRRRSATRSTGSTPTPTHIAYFNSGANPVRAKGIDHDFPVAAQVRVARLEPGHLAARASRRFAQHPQVDRPALPGQLEQQAGARLPRPPTTNAYSSTYRSVLLEDRRRRRRSRARASSTLPEADRRDGAGGHRPTCARTSTCRWRCA